MMKRRNTNGRARLTAAWNARNVTPRADITGWLSKKRTDSSITSGTYAAGPGCADLFRGD